MPLTPVVFLALHTQHVALSHTRSAVGMLERRKWPCIHNLSRLINFNFLAQRLFTLPVTCQLALNALWMHFAAGLRLWLPGMLVNVFSFTSFLSHSHFHYICGSKSPFYPAKDYSTCQKCPDNAICSGKSTTISWYVQHILQAECLDLSFSIHCLIWLTLYSAQYNVATSTPPLPRMELAASLSRRAQMAKEPLWTFSTPETVLSLSWP